MEQKSVILEQETLSVLELMGRMANMTHRCRAYKYEILSLIGRRYQTNLKSFPSKKPFFTWSPSAAFGPKGPRRNGNTAGGEMEGEKVLFFFSESPPTHDKNNGVFDPPKVIKWEESWIMFSLSLSPKHWVWSEREECKEQFLIRTTFCFSQTIKEPFFFFPWQRSKWIDIKERTESF